MMKKLILSAKSIKLYQAFQEHSQNLHHVEIFKSILLAVRKHNQTNDKLIKIVVCPGLGTGTGKVPPLEAARQMALAYKNFLNPPDTITWDFAGKRQREIIYGGDMGFQLN
jgi:O-acetyl-ADP-ribose deacetylase (regulator of RNase III)